MTFSLAAFRSNRYVLAAILGSAALVLFLALSFIQNVQKSLWRNAVRNLLETTVQGANGLGTALQKDMDVLAAFAQDLRGINADDPEQIHKKLVAFSRFGTRIIFATKEGGYQATQSSPLPLPPAVEKVLEKPQTAGGGIEPHIHPITGRRVLSVYVPVVVQGGNRALLLMSTPIEKLYGHYSPAFYGNQGYSYVVDEHGGIVLRSIHHLSNKTFVNVFDILQHNQSRNADKLKEKMREGKTGALLLENDERDVLLCYTPLNINDWYFLSVIPKNVIMRDANAILQSAFVLCLAMAACLLFIVNVYLRTNEKYTNEAQYRQAIVSEAYLALSFNITRNRLEAVLCSQSPGFSASAQGLSSLDGFAESWARERVLPEDREAFLSHMERDGFLAAYARGEKEDECEYRLRSEAGDLVYIRQSLLLTEDQGTGEIWGLLVAKDVTENKLKEKQYTEALVAAYENADQASKAKSEFLSCMSHDIRTPMNGVIGMTAIALANLHDAERVRDCLHKISRSSEHLLSLINEVLDMSKIESGKLSLAESEMNLAELVENLLTMIRPSLEEKRHTFEVLLGNLAHEDVIGDPLRIQQVFTNVMSNAVKYTPEGGTIHFRIREHYNEPSNYAQFQFEIEDNGMGMDEAFQKRLFTPFERADNARLNNIPGTGLGMAITQSIVRLMGGEIKVDSELGKGTKCTITLNLKLQDKREHSTHGLEGLRVLIVDDDPDTCENICLILDKAGLKSEWASSGMEGIARVRAAQERDEGYCALLVDWKMPGMDGLETVRRIRAEIGGSMPIIILSSYDWTDIEAEALGAGVNAFLAKPLFRSRLLYLLKKLVSPSGTEGEHGLLPAGTDFSDMNVLLVEDNDLNMEIAREIIGLTGARVEEAENGQAAVEKVRLSPEFYYNMIFMDIQMPVMNGYEAARAIRALPREDVADLPVIAMTADAFAEDIQKAHDAGMDGHIAKPLDFDLLYTMMAKWLSLHRGGVSPKDKP